MPRLIDRLLIEDFSKNSRFKKMSELLGDSIFFSVDNVAKHYFEESEKDVWLVDSFPNIAPPYQTFFMEYRLPNFVNVGGKIKENRVGKNNPYVGMLFQCNEISDENQGLISDFQGDKKSVKWHFLCLPFLWSNNSQDIVSPIYCSYRFLVDEFGQMCKKENGDPMFGTGFFKKEVEELCAKNGVNVESFTKMISNDSNNAVAPFLLAISFMHCKNVTVEQVTPDAPVSKIYHKKHGRPLEKYHILNIEPMRKVLRTEGNSQKTGLKQALHICRGHFKDFSKGKGLFGKFKGLYWWDNQVRGSHQQGIVDKDYNVKTPKESKD